MDAEKDKSPACPVGEASCQWLDELARVNKRVDELAELVSHDPLTGLFNYRHFCDVLPMVLERTRRSLRPACLIMIDLDHFKNINDKWGHEVGNIVLKLTARILKQQVRMVDVVCRYGGEEFVVILPDTGLRQAVDVAGRIRRAIEETPVILNEGEFNFTASMGVGIYRTIDSLSEEEFIESVDKYLYQAKEAGRNRVCHREIAEVESQTSVSKAERDALLGLFDGDSK